MLRLQLSFCW